MTLTPYLPTPARIAYEMRDNSVTILNILRNKSQTHQDDLNKEADAESDVGGHNCNGEMDVGNERSGRIESNDNRAASCGGISNYEAGISANACRVPITIMALLTTIEQSDLNINFDLQVKKNINQVLTTV